MERTTVSVLLLCEAGIAASLLLQQFEELDELAVSWSNAKNVQFITQLESFDVIVVNYHYHQQSFYQDVLRTETLDFNLIVYNLPADISIMQLIEWKRLKGILWEDSPLDHLAKSVKEVSQGSTWLPRPIMGALLEYYRKLSIPKLNPLVLLTKRERQILERLVCGQSNKQIADGLFVTESTVKTHIYKLYKKMNVRNRGEAIDRVRSVREDVA